MEGTDMGKENWNRLISAVSAAIAASCSIWFLSDGSIFSKRRFSLLASLSRISLACLFSGVSLARLSRMASRSRCRRRARCSSVSCILCRRFASRSRKRRISCSSGDSHARLVFLAVRSRSSRCVRTSTGSFFLRIAHFRMDGDWASTSCW